MPLSILSHVQSSLHANSLVEFLSFPLFIAEQNSNWQVLLRRFRSLRATLVSHDQISWFAVRVYLWSTDVSLYSTDHAECLKALQALACQLFPALDAQDKACHSLCSLASSSKPEDTETCKDWGKDSWLSADQKSESADTEPCPVRQIISDHWHELQDKRETENANTASRSSLHCLWAHCAGLLVLYFTCVPQTKQSMDVMSILRNLPCGLLASDAVQFSLKAYSALGAGDVKTFLRLHGKADWRQLRFLNLKVIKVHEYGLAIMCASYRRLACADAQRMLGLQGTVPDQQLITLLKALGNRGNQFAVIAKDSILQGSVQLVFRS